MSSLDALITLGGDDLPLYYDALVQISNNQQGRTIIDNYLGERPVWGTNVLFERMKKMSKADIPSILSSLNKFIIINVEKDWDRGLQEYFLQKLIALKSYEQAYMYWKKTVGMEEKPTKSYLHDPNFSGSLSLPPFNWKIQRDSDHFAELKQGGGLYGSYAGNKQIILAYQISLLLAGNYYFETDAQWSYRQREGVFLGVYTACLCGNKLWRLKWMTNIELAVCYVGTLLSHNKDVML